MSTNPNYQVIPFPLPPYLASFFSNKITTVSCINNDGSKIKPFQVNRHSIFGSFLLRILEKQERPNFIENGYTFFLKIENHIISQEKNTPNSKYSFVDFDEKSVSEIIKVFKAFFEEALFNYVAGAEEITYKFSQKKRGVKTSAIESFCKKYGVIYSNKNLIAWEKAIYRDKIRVNALKSSVL